MYYPARSGRSPPARHSHCFDLRFCALNAGGVVDAAGIEPACCVQSFAGFMRSLAFRAHLTSQDKP